jgi:hypothetical protein
MDKKKIAAIQIAVAFILSNAGIALCSYAGFKMGWYTSGTLWRVLFYDGVYFCIGSAANIFSLLRFAS